MLLEISFWVLCAVVGLFLISITCMLAAGMLRYWRRYGSFWPATSHVHAQAILMNGVIIGQDGNGDWLIPPDIPLKGFRVHMGHASARLRVQVPSGRPAVAKDDGYGNVQMEFLDPITVLGPFPVSFFCRSVSVEPGRVVLGRSLAAS